MVRTETAPIRSLAVLLLLAAFLLVETMPASGAARIRRERLESTTPVQAITAEELEKMAPPINIADVLAVQPGVPVVVNGSYSQVNLRGIGSNSQPPVNLHLRGGKTAAGADVTAIDIPEMASLGRATMRFISPGRDPYEKDIILYAYLDAYLDQKRLSSGQRAMFRYDLDFGEGPGQITVTVRTTGPISYPNEGRPQILSIDRTGKARLTDYITAIRGSPTGIPFSITPDFSNLSLRAR